MIDVKAITDKIKSGESTPAAPASDAAEETDETSHMDRIKAAADKIKEGMAELESCINEY